MKYLIALLLTIELFSCKSTKKIQTAISKRDTVVRILVSPPDHGKNDTMEMIRTTLSGLAKNNIRYKTFSAKINTDYKSADGKTYNVNATVRMYKDSLIWISANALLGIEAMRVLITKDSVKLLDKLSKVYTARSVSYLQEVTALPLDLATLQNLIIGNAVFLDSNIVSYSSDNNVINLLSVGKWFKNLLTLNASNKTLIHSKLDDADINRNRTADLTYTDYDDKFDFPFSTHRKIIVAEKKRLEITLDFRQYNINPSVNFSFPVPRNYDRN
ncbi:MAG TPA: DUF4292 domain-containing protein [Flavisolibacter sp.]|jgi:hypothetical protein|nr:DUF4292 domain-containing protein [Flavisolibacter sp.]